MCDGGGRGRGAILRRSNLEPFNYWKNEFINRQTKIDRQDGRINNLDIVTGCSVLGIFSLLNIVSHE